MIGKLVVSFIVAAVVGVGCIYLLAPLLLLLNIGITDILGEFFARFGWAIGVAAGLLYFFRGRIGW